MDISATEDEVPSWGPVCISRTILGFYGPILIVILILIFIGIIRILK